MCYTCSYWFNFCIMIFKGFKYGIVVSVTEIATLGLSHSCLIESS